MGYFGKKILCHYIILANYGGWCKQKPGIKIPKDVIWRHNIFCVFQLPLKNEKSANEEFADFRRQQFVLFGRGTGSYTRIKLSLAVHKLPDFLDVFS